jgi:hypothetical protein
VGRTGSTWALRWRGLGFRSNQFRPPKIALGFRCSSSLLWKSLEQRPWMMWTTFLQQQKAWKFYLKLAVGVVETWGPELGGYNKIWLRYWGKWWRRRGRGGRGGSGGGLGLGVEKKKLFICFEDTTTKVADSGRKEGKEPLLPRVRRAEIGDQKLRSQGKEGQPHHTFTFLLLWSVSHERASERGEGAGEIWSLQEGRKEGRKSSKQAELGTDCRQK